MKSNRNKTIDTSIQDGKQWLDKCVSKPTIDCTVLGDTFSVLPLIPNESIDLIIIDPPYNLTKQFASFTFRKRSLEEYETYTKRWLQLVIPLMKPTATLYVCCDWFSSLTIGKVLQENLYLQNRITWEREKGRGAKTNWKNSMEDIWFATKTQNYTFNIDAVKVRKKVIAPYKENGIAKDWEETSNGKYRDTYPSNFWGDITVPFWSMPENTSHPTQKSEKLIAKLILASSNKNDVVLDPFCGSGTVSVVAKKLQRHYIGIEQEPQYAMWTEQRLEMAETDNTIQGYNGIFYERNEKVSS